MLLTGGLQLAETHGFVSSQLRARLNISFLQLPDDPRLVAHDRIGRPGAGASDGQP